MSHLPLYLSIISRGLALTVELTVGGIVLTIVDAFVAGMAGRSRYLPVRFLVRVYVEGWRGTSELVQLFWVYYVAPLIIGLHLVPLWAGIIVLGLNNGAYGAEIVRGALEAVPKAQQEGAVALSLGPWQRMRRVMLPQALVEMVPPFNTLFIQLLQATALISLINGLDITYQSKQVLMNAYPISQDPAILFLLLVLYLILAVILTGLMRLLEVGLARYAGRPPARQVRWATAFRPGMFRPGQLGPGGA